MKIFLPFILLLHSCLNHSPNIQVMRIKTRHGDILIKLLPENAPNTVERIKYLVNINFYNGLRFHRVIPGFLIQTGDPTGTGYNGSGQKLKAEFTQLKHKRGTVAMARAHDKDSADSQFYISLKPLPHLDSKYTIFGEVFLGDEVLDKIKINDKIIMINIE